MVFMAGETIPGAGVRDPLARPDRPADRLLKINLPPVMGRRDAASDCAGQLVLAGFTGTRDELDALRRLTELLRSARADTERIFAMLSSPDTIARERRMLAFFTLTAGAVENICNLLSLEEIFNHGAANTTLTVHAAETNARWLCEYFASAEPRLRRYRDYALKNFSPDYAARYERAYGSFSKIFVNH